MANMHKCVNCGKQINPDTDTFFYFRGIFCSKACLKAKTGVYPIPGRVDVKGDSSVLEKSPGRSRLI